MNCVTYIIDYMKELMELSSDDAHYFHVTDIKVVNNLLFISEMNSGIYVFEFQLNTFEIKDFFLYPLTSSPNMIYVERQNDYQYQLLVSTVENNEILIFEPIKVNQQDFKVSEVLKINRIHAFSLPKYYSFGLINSLNDDFMLNELYNSMKKTVSIRVSSRQRNSMDDSTLKILDLNIPISTVVYMGFIESYTNLFVLITANKMWFYQIHRPYLSFNAMNVRDPPNRPGQRIDKHFTSMY